MCCPVSPVLVSVFLFFCLFLVLRVKLTTSRLPSKHLCYGDESPAQFWCLVEAATGHTCHRRRVPGDRPQAQARGSHVRDSPLRFRRTEKYQCVIFTGLFSTAGAYAEQGACLGPSTVVPRALVLSCGHSPPTSATSHFCHFLP